MTVKVAPKLGLDQKDPDLERRLRFIESELDKAAIASTAAGVGEDSSTLQLAPAPFNLSITNPIDNVTVSWEAEKPSDFIEYEVQVDETTEFSSPAIFFTKENRFTYREGIPGVTYFF